MRNNSFFTKVLLLIATIFICGIIFSSLALFFGKVIFGNNFLENVNYLRFMQSLSSIGTFLIPSLIMTFFIEKNGKTISQIKLTPHVNVLLIVTILSVTILPIIACLGYWNQQIHLPDSLNYIEEYFKTMEDQAQALLNLMFSDHSVVNLLLNILLLALIPAICEEFIFRGTIQNMLLSKIKYKSIAIIITAFIFSFIHFQFYGFIPRFLLGIYLGYLVVISKSLWLPVLAHFLHNSLSILADFFMSNNNIDPETVTPANIHGMFPVTVFCFVIFISGVYLLFRYSAN